MKNELPDGWEWKTLGDFAEINPRFDSKSISKEMKVSFIPMACVEELTGGIDTSNEKKVEEVIKGYTPLKDNDLLFAKITPCMENGKIAIASNLKNNIGFASTEFHVIRFNETAYNKFYFFYLIQEKIRNYAELNMKGSAGQKRVPTDFLRRLSVPFPPLETQHKIVSILEKAEETKKLRAQAGELTQQLLQSVFLEMFGDPVQNNKKFHTDSLSNLCDVKSGGTPSRKNKEFFEGDIPWITTVSLGSKHIDSKDAIEFITEEAVENSATKIIPEYSVMVGVRIGVGKASINKCRMCTNQDIISLVNINSKLNKYYLLGVLAHYSIFFESQMRGATIKGITSATLKELTIPLPPIELQEKYEFIIQKMDAATKNQKAVQNELESLFNTLMQKAFNGELVS